MTATDIDAAVIAALFRKPVTFIAGVVDPQGLPPPSLPEIAVVGRSNVGKSSILNALLGRTIARISQRPGRTQQLNFFDLAGQLMLVDMPGYGYAEASKAKIKEWSRLITAYLQTRQVLRRVFILVDSRHGLKTSDREVFAILDTFAVSYQVVLTKIDKIGSVEQEACLEAVRKELKTHPAAFPEVIATSSKTQAGIAALQGAIYQLI